MLTDDGRRRTDDWLYYKLTSERGSGELIKIREHSEAFKLIFYDLIYDHIFINTVMSINEKCLTLDRDICVFLHEALIE